MQNDAIRLKDYILRDEDFFHHKQVFVEDTRHPARKPVGEHYDPYGNSTIQDKHVAFPEDKS